MTRRATLTTALACAVVFQSCQSTTGGEKGSSSLLPSAQRAPDRAPDWYFKTGVYGGYSEVDDVGRTLDGYSAGGRFELGRVLDPATGHVELGGRLSVGETRADGSNPMVPGRDIDYSGIHVFIEPVFRYYLSESGARPYGEVFVGYGYSDFEVESVPPDVHDDGSGVTYGVGLGVEFPLTTSLSGPLHLAVGIELRETTSDSSSFGDIDQEDLMGTFLFGTRW